MIQIGDVYSTFCQEEAILLLKCRDRNGWCIAILFESIGFRGRFDSPDVTCEGRTLKPDRQDASSHDMLASHAMPHALRFTT